MFGPIYDVETNQIIIYEGDYEKLLEMWNTQVISKLEPLK